MVAARLIDRVGKGLRGAPRDALVADLAPPGLRGLAFASRWTRSGTLPGHFWRSA